MTITLRIRRILAAAAATVALMAVGLPAAQADASIGKMSASLTIAPYSGAFGVQSVKVAGYVVMTPAEAQSLIDQRYNVVIRLWGDDEFSDNLLLGPYSPDEFYAEQGVGLRFKSQKQVGNSILNEDWGDDEVYAGVRLLKPSTATLKSVETLPVRGSW